MTAIAQPAVYVAVYCSGTKRNGRACPQRLARVNVERWEVDMACEAELVCEQCGKRYTLREYR